MPISLRVKPIEEPIKTSELLPKVSAALKEILGLPDPPRIVVEEWTFGRLAASPPQTISTKSGMVSFRIPGDPDEVAYLYCYRSAVHEPSDEATPQAGIDVGSGRRPLDFALAAAIAAAVARDNNSDVIDDTPFFSKAMDQPGDSFIESVRVKHSFDDHHRAAKTFFEALYGKRAAKEKSPSAKHL